jgi:hypothetical protein
LDLITSDGDPRDLEEFNAEALRLASSFAERSIGQLAHKLGISDQRDPTYLGQASTGLASVPWTVQDGEQFAAILSSPRTNLAYPSEFR